MREKREIKRREKLRWKGGKQEKGGKEGAEEGEGRGERTRR